jgi:hypothetical protein
MTDADARRVIDFAAGLIFGLRGYIDKVERMVFFLAHADMDYLITDGHDSRDHTYTIVMTFKRRERWPREDSVGKTDDSGDLLDLLHVVL